MKWPNHTIVFRGLEWDDFVDRLTTLLRGLAEAEDRFVIVSIQDPHRFVQFASEHSPNRLMGEAISNQFLEGEARLSKSALGDARLASGNREAALAAYREALEHLTVTLGESHAATVAVRRRLG